MGVRGRRESDEHREFEDMAVAHVVGGLTVDQGRMFRSHLLECTSCRARVGELRAIAHDLADVERDERRIRTAKRTETKSHDGEEPDGPVSAPPRLSARLTLLTAAGLTILMALSAWNFVLRGRLQQAEQTERTVGDLPRSVAVLQDGQAWETVRSPASGDGRVSTLGQEMVIMVDGLPHRRYGLYLLGPDDEPIFDDVVATTNGVLYELVVNHQVDSAERAVLIEADGRPLQPDLTDAEFVAHRPDQGQVDVHPVVEPSD